jgi:hypothetical protein
VVLANALSGETLRYAFAGLMVIVAAQLTRRALASSDLTGLAVKDPMTEHDEVETGHDHGGA